MDSQFSRSFNAAKTMMAKNTQLMVYGPNAANIRTLYINVNYVGARMLKPTELTPEAIRFLTLPENRTSLPSLFNRMSSELMKLALPAFVKAVGGTIELLERKAESMAGIDSDRRNQLEDAQATLKLMAEDRGLVVPQKRSIAVGEGSKPFLFPVDWNAFAAQLLAAKSRQDN